MYPKNAASPEPIAIGAVVQISDGAVQTSGVTVRIKPIGVAEGDGAGTTAYSTDGVVLYTPTQAETNYTSFVLIAKKTGCIPVAITVVTTSSATPGTVLLSPVTHTSAVIPTVTTAVNLTNAPTNGDLTATMKNSVTAAVPSAAQNAAAVEAAILNEGDATALLAAIAAKVEEFLINEGDATATITAIAAACNAAVAAGTVGTNAATAATQATTAATQATSAAGTASTINTKIGTPAVSVSADVAAVKTDTAATLIDTNELQTDWANGGRLDLILDAADLWSKRAAVLATGLLTGAGTNTEVYTISALGITATCTTDTSGNRTAVVWS